jgi:hypothetical protein
MVCRMGSFDQQLPYVLHHAPMGMLEPKDERILVGERTARPHRHTTISTVTFRFGDQHKKIWVGWVGNAKHLSGHYTPRILLNDQHLHVDRLPGPEP